MIVTEQDFIRNIVASPDDDTLRLVFADWLDEHDQPERAEFIRIQIELSRMPPPHKRIEGLKGRGTIVASSRGGDDYREVESWASENIQVGDRVDVLQFRTGPRKPVWQYGWRVIHVDREHQYAEEGGPFNVTVAIDQHSKPWAGTALARRESELFKKNQREWLPKCVQCRRTGAIADCSEGGCPHCGNSGIRGPGHVGRLHRGLLESVPVPRMRDVLTRVELEVSTSLGDLGSYEWRATRWAKNLFRDFPTVQRIIAGNKRPNDRRTVSQGWMFANLNNEELRDEENYDQWFIPGEVFEEMRHSRVGIVPEGLSPYWLSFLIEEAAIDCLAESLTKVVRRKCSLESHEEK